MIREQILETAIKTVCQDKQDLYGAVENNFQLIADFWSAYLNTPVKAVDVAMMMGMLKIARIRTGKFTQDNFVDLAGYAACGAEVAELDVSKKQDETLQKLQHVKELIAERDENREEITEPDQCDTPPRKETGEKSKET